MSQITSTLREVYTSNGLPLGNTSVFADNCDNHFQYSIEVPDSGPVTLFASGKSITQFTEVRDTEVKYLRIANKGNEVMTMTITDGSDIVQFKIPAGGFFVVYSSQWTINRTPEDITLIAGQADANSTRVEVLIGVE